MLIGTNDLDIIGGRFAVLTANNSAFSGRFNVSGGATTLRAPDNAALGTRTGADVIMLGSGGRFQAGTPSAGLDLTLSATRGITLPGGNGHLHPWTGFTLTVPGPITGPGTLVKDDGGVAVLSGVLD